MNDFEERGCETMGFSYSGMFDNDNVHVNMSVNPPLLTLDVIAERFKDFLVSSGFTYVTEVVFVTNPEAEI